MILPGGSLVMGSVAGSFGVSAAGVGPMIRRKARQQSRRAPRMKISWRREGERSHSVIVKCGEQACQWKNHFCFAFRVENRAKAKARRVLSFAARGSCSVKRRAVH